METLCLFKSSSYVYRTWLFCTSQVFNLSLNNITTVCLMQNTEVGISAHISGNDGACKTKTSLRWLISPLHSRSQCPLICLSCLWQPWQLITFCGSFLWVVIYTGRSASHMFFDYWRWCARTLSAHCVVLSEADTQVRACNQSPTYANELLSSNMHGALPGQSCGRGVILQELWEQSFSILWMPNEEWPVGEACLTRVKAGPARFPWRTLQISFDC